MKTKFIIFLMLITSLILTGCTNKLSEVEIKEQLEENNENRTFTVNEVTYATDKIIINEIEMKVKSNEIIINDYSIDTPSQQNIQITGYYDQSAAIYNIYILAKDQNGKVIILKTEKDETTTFNDIEWTKMDISNAKNLILIDCIEEVKPIGQTPLRHQVYTLVNSELKLIS